MPALLHGEESLEMTGL